MKNSRGGWFPYIEPNEFPLWLPYSAHEKSSWVVIIVECACFISHGGIQRVKNPADTVHAIFELCSIHGGVLVGGSSMIGNIWCIWCTQPASR